jgi:protein phosphatase 1L
MASGLQPDAGRGQSPQSHHIVHGFSLVKGKSRHAMEDYHVAEFRKVRDHEVGLFAVYDGHLGHNVADYLQQHLFNNILNEVYKSVIWMAVKSCFLKYPSHV